MRYRQHKLVFELGWRAYYRHAWAHLGSGIHSRSTPACCPTARTNPRCRKMCWRRVPASPAIDLAVRELYETGYIHNHARMWLASYVVHLRKVHWHAGAQWMLGYLLDGDQASNHLSWQWVAGLGSSKPYIFNADNVAKYAAALGTVRHGNRYFLRGHGRVGTRHAAPAHAPRCPSSWRGFRPTCVE